MDASSQLQEQIDKQRKLIKADGYPMSIGELLSMYKDGDLFIQPSYQRFFRWDLEQKSRWIESLLLGIPAPSIFVAQRQNGVWDVVDGLQRLSTIFEFMGILKEPSGKLKAALVLEGTRYLPALDGTSWESGEKTMSEDQRRFLKREKLDIKIVKRESDESSKYELFQRLNTGGSALSDQELRNCMLVSIDESFFDWIQSLSTDTSFIGTVPLPERLMQERFEVELVLRFILFRNIDTNEFKKITSLTTFVTDKMLALVNNKSFDRAAEESLFRNIFQVLATALGDDAFRKFNTKNQKFTGAFLYSAFEIIAMGLGHSATPRVSLADPDKIVAIIKEKVWADAGAVGSKTGESAVARLQRTLELGRKIFKAS